MTRPREVARQARARLAPMFGGLLLLGCARAAVPAPVASPYPMPCPGARIDAATARDTMSLPLGALRPRPESVGPRTPAALRGRGNGGSVIASVAIDTTGAIDPRGSVILHATDVRYARAVCEALPRIRFVPLVRDGRAVAVRVAQHFEFRTGAP